jgi:glycosyltransferase involved in cell wall biosynthesis
MVEPLRVTVIATVLNEAQTIGVWLESFLNQSRQPDEMIIVDGGSTDGTPDLIRRYANQLPLKILVEQGANISRGRNLAIANATHPIIASTDAGTRLHPDWLRELMYLYEQNPSTANVAGFFMADYNPQSPFEVAMSATVLPSLTDINPQTFLPSSRSVAFRKSAWEQVQGYPEWLDYCEDLIFDIRLKALAGGFSFAPNAIAYFKPRPSLKSYWTQYYRYARGDGKADLWRKRHIIRYITYLAIIPLIFLLGIVVHPVLWLLYLAGGIGYLYRPYIRLRKLWGELAPLQKLSAAMWVAVIRVVGDVAKMVGYPVGWWWRWQNHPPAWKP